MIYLKNIVKKYKSGSEEISALNDVSAEIKSGELTVILGPSGSGKSTMLNLLGGMDRPSSGQILINNKDLSNFSDKQLTNYRRKNVGFVFQFYNLVENLNTYENVGIAANLNGNIDKVEEIIKDVGLEKRMKNFPNQLSGGEMQRVAIARAVAKSPKLLLCDEPTGALDVATGDKIFHLLKKYSKNEDTAVVVVTHNPEVAKIADHVIRLQDGKIYSDEK
ncbi:putative ABC transport system ATP-binding protein [Eubacterium uniforme]|uniref:Putative ABC transport system ATP-binding protein n=1 Tax=Eubacterium uniforme TaxID=39495 RepID=A0A1T4VAF6_9FIRM|nr:ABC transporter ATP-binding protein [Eubacterium uniforme]SKA61521.1 putative ABC transport system ATP-binding protein [Eubacterium uniforme]